MSIIEIKVPDIGDFKEVEVIEVLVKAGDEIKVEQSLITVESDKASMEIPSSSAGVVKELKVKVGDKVTSGLIKDTVRVPRDGTCEVEFVADNPGDSLLHCHMQHHMDYGFKTMVKYV